MTNPHTDKPFAILMAIVIVVLSIKAGLSVYAAVIPLFPDNQPKKLIQPEATRD